MQSQKYESSMACCRPEGMPHEAGIWFPRFKPMFSHYEASEQRHRLFCVSWDRNSQGSKVFGLFEGAAQYFRVIRQMPPGTVCGYELLLENRPCKLYLDVEWETSGGGADTAASETMEAICRAVTHKIRRDFRPTAADAQASAASKKEEQLAWQQLELDFYVSTCSRVKSVNVFKNSFHVVVNNLIFPNNHDGMMKQFAISLDFPACVDQEVYSRNRCIRTELSAKAGQLACFRNMQALPAGHSAEEAEAHLLVSLITIFDGTLPLVRYKDADTQKMHSTYGAPKKRRAVYVGCAVGTDAPKKTKLATPPDSASHVTAALNAYFKHIFCDDAQTNISVRGILDSDPLPPVVRQLLERGIVKAGGIFFVYIQKAKLCISKLMHAVKHSHHSNNACAVALEVDGRVDIYARCYGCNKHEYAALACFDKKSKLLPSLGLPCNDALRRIVHSPYGIDCVKDSVDRKRVLCLFQKTEGEIKTMLHNTGSPNSYTASVQYLWSKYVDSAARGWFFISEPCTETPAPMGTCCCSLPDSSADAPPDHLQQDAANC